MSKDNSHPISFKVAQEQFRKVVGLPVQRVYRSLGTWLWIDFGEMRPWRVKHEVTGETYENEEGDLTLEFEGKWVCTKDDNLILNPYQILEGKDLSEAGKLLDQSIDDLKLDVVHHVRFDEETESITFSFENGLAIVATVDDVGLVNLHDHRESFVTAFEVQYGQFFQEKALLPFKGRQG